MVQNIIELSTPFGTLSEKRASQAVSMIYKGSTWEECVNKIGVSYDTIRRDLIRHYEKSGGADSAWYKRICAKQRENAEKRKNAPIHLVETGAILTRGMTWLINLSKNAPFRTGIPLFCHEELRKLSQQNVVAKRFLETKNLDIAYLLPCKENLGVGHASYIPYRLIAIASTAVRLAKSGRRVVVHTNSSALRQILEAQNEKIVVDYLRTSPSF